MPDVEIPFERMEELSNALGLIVTEFAEAASRTGALEDAIGTPLDGYTALRDRASDFESNWDDKRETLRRKLAEMKQRVDETREAWADLDAELAAMQEGAE